MVCNGLQCLQRFAMVWSGLQRFAMFCNGLQRFAMVCNGLQYFATWQTLAGAAVSSGRSQIDSEYPCLQWFAIVCNRLLICGGTESMQLFAMV